MGQCPWKGEAGGQEFVAEKETWRGGRGKERGGEIEFYEKEARPRKGKGRIKKKVRE